MKLEVENLSKSYKSLHALSKMEYIFESGIYALLGPNGAGKSTFMNILVTLLQADEGKVMLNDKDVNLQKKEYLDMLGYMPQQQCLYDDFTCKDFLYYIGNLKGMKKSEIVKRSAFLCKEVRLEDSFYKKIGTFSGGMKQRVMLAATLMNDPKILILDEPTAGLDPMKRTEIQNMIASFAKDKIVLIATHVVSDVEFISKRFLFLQKGKLILDGSRKEVIDTLEHKVKEIEVVDEEYQKLKERYIVSALYYKRNILMARIIDMDDQLQAEIVTPTISDVYFYLFKGK